MLDGTREETGLKTGEGGPDTKEAEALASALNRSAERVQALWFSFLLFMLYLAIAAGTTTHRMLFLESPLNLPVLNIALPLLGFYILTPIIFVVFHFYMLLNLVLLARTAKSFEDSLERAFPEDGEARENFRMRIENTLFVQLLVGGRLERQGFNARLLSLMALITLAVAPVALLLYLQIKFLPYHSDWITWLHRGLLALDLVLVWTLWPGYRSGWGVRLRPEVAWWLVGPGIGTAAALVYAVLVATFPDERMYLATNWLHEPTHEVSSPDSSSWYALIAPVNTLDLHGEDLVDDAKLKQIIEKNESSILEFRWVASWLLAGRDLTGADLGYADIRHVAFFNAVLNRANFSHAWANDARFLNAQLQGASLKNSQLQDASLHHTQLQGASLDRAQLQGADLGYARLQGASLDRAQLQGAKLIGAELQGASLDGAQLQGASLFGARLQGASLKGAQLQGAFFDKVCVWRADAREAQWGNTLVRAPQTSVKESPSNEINCSWTQENFEDAKKLITGEVPKGRMRDEAMKRIEKSLNPKIQIGNEARIAEDWEKHEKETPTLEAYANTLGKMGCAADGARYIRDLLDRLEYDFFVDKPFPKNSPEVPKLAAAFLDKDCAGARGFSEDEIAKLKALAAKAPPPVPKQ